MIFHTKQSLELVQKRLQKNLGHRLKHDRKKPQIPGLGLTGVEPNRLSSSSLNVLCMLRCFVIAKLLCRSFDPSLLKLGNVEKKNFAVLCCMYDK